MIRDHQKVQVSVKMWDTDLSVINVPLTSLIPSWGEFVHTKILVCWTVIYLGAQINHRHSLPPSHGGLTVLYIYNVKKRRFFIPGFHLKKMSSLPPLLSSCPWLPAWTALSRHLVLHLVYSLSHTFHNPQAHESKFDIAFGLFWQLWLQMSGYVRL